MKKHMIAVVSGLILAGQAAQAVTVNAVDSGTFQVSSSSGGIGAGTNLAHNSNDTSISFSFSIGGFVNISQNAFAIFDLSAFSGNVTSASLEMSLTNNAIGLGVPGAFSFHQVSSGASLFNSSYDEHSNCSFIPNCQPLGTGYAIYNDLASGTSLGTLSYSGVGSQTTTLNTTGIDLLNSSLGGLLVVGIDSAANNGLGSVAFASPQLTLEVTAVPVPAAIWLFGSGIIGLIGLAKQKPLSGHS